MKLLAVETATDACSAALYQDGEVLSRFEIAPREHARLILPMLDSLLAEAGCALAQVDAIGLGRGPGAFTGVRIAVGVVQGIAFAADLPVVPVSTLATLAAQVVAERGEDRVLAALDARMGEVYWGVYRADAQTLVRLEGAEMVLAPERVPMPEGRGGFGAGSGWGPYAELLTHRLGGQVSGHDAGLYPHAAHTARLAAVAFARGKALPVERVEPVYLRDRVVERPA